MMRQREMDRLHTGSRSTTLYEKGPGLDILEEYGPSVTTTGKCDGHKKNKDVRCCSPIALFKTPTIYKHYLELALS